MSLTVAYGHQTALLHPTVLRVLFVTGGNRVSKRNAFAWGNKTPIFKQGLISGPVILTASVGSLKTPLQQMNLSMKQNERTDVENRFLQLLPQGSEWGLVSGCRAGARGTQASGAEAPGLWSSAAWSQLPSAWGTLLRSNSCPQHWQADSWPLYSQGSPRNTFIPKVFTVFV